MPQKYNYTATITWTGDTGEGTSNYKGYERSHEVKIEGKPTIQASSDPAFRGDKTKHNPEDLLLASVSGCHMMWYLHLCAEAGVVVMSYEDKATGIMETDENGSGRFTEITLHPERTLEKYGVADFQVNMTFDKPWNSNLISEKGKKALKEFGLAPPPSYNTNLILDLDILEHVPCPYCNSTNTDMRTPFGPTLCRSMHYCNDCRQMFEQFKPL